MAIRPMQRYALITELNEEWARLVNLHRDAVPWPDVAWCVDLAEVLAAIRSDPDPLLRSLLRETAAGDQLAGRTVLQAMLGKVVRLAQAHPRAGVDDFLSALWCRIRTYPLERRPTRIAANLALDTRKDVLAQLRRTTRESAAGTWSEPREERLLHALGVRSEAATDPADAQAQRLIEHGEASGMIDAATSSALRSVYLDGVSSATAAARLGTSPGMVRYRCSRGVRALSRQVAASRKAAESLYLFGSRPLLSKKAMS